MRTVRQFLFPRHDLATLASYGWAARSGLTSGLVLAAVGAAWRVAEGRREWGLLAFSSALVVAFSVAVQLWHASFWRRRQAALSAHGRLPPAG